MTESAAYRYYDGSMDIVHTTSVPRDDEAAFAYVEKVDGWLPGTRVRFIERRLVGAREYYFLPVQVVEGKVVTINGDAAQES